MYQVIERAALYSLRVLIRVLLLALSFTLVGVKHLSRCLIEVSKLQVAAFSLNQRYVIFRIRSIHSFTQLPTPTERKDVSSY